MLFTFLKGAAVGFAIAAPVGPIGVLCVRRSLAEGPGAGFAVGLGAAVADACYGAIAGFGLTAITGFLVGARDWLGLGGGALLAWFGWRTLRAAPSATAADVAGGDLWRAFLGTFALTLANPATILSFVALFAGLGTVMAFDYVTASWFVLGVLSGSALWWLILSQAAGALRSRLTLDAMRWVNRCSGVVVLGCGILAIAVSVFRWGGASAG
jgi:threonine/homoserine/homoserine lactone efflux protein